jgi:aminopeptidase-like protein
VTNDTIIEQLEAIEALLPVSFEIEETPAGDIVFDMESPHGFIVKRTPDQ